MRSPPVRLARPFRFRPCPCTHPLGCCGLRCLGAKVLFKGKGIHVSNLVVVARMEAVCVDETWRRLAVGVLFLGFVLCDLRMRKRKRRKGRTGWRVFERNGGWLSVPVRLCPPSHASSLLRVLGGAMDG